MKERPFAPVIVRIAAAVCVLCPLLAGCGNDQERRASVEFHLAGTRTAIDRVKMAVEHAHDESEGGRGPGGLMLAATEQLRRCLEGLPARIEKKASTRVEERKAAAEKARQFFEQLRPTLLSLRFDQAEMLDKLRQLSGMLDEVQRA